MAKSKKSATPPAPAQTPPTETHAIVGRRAWITEYEPHKWALVAATRGHNPTAISHQHHLYPVAYHHPVVGSLWFYEHMKSLYPNGAEVAFVRDELYPDDMTSWGRHVTLVNNGGHRQISQINEGGIPLLQIPALSNLMYQVAWHVSGSSLALHQQVQEHFHPDPRTGPDLSGLTLVALYRSALAVTMAPSNFTDEFYTKFSTHVRHLSLANVIAAPMTPQGNHNHQGLQDLYNLRKFYWFDPEADTTWRADTNVALGRVPDGLWNGVLHQPHHWLAHPHHLHRDYVTGGRKIGSPLDHI